MLILLFFCHHWLFRHGSRRRQGGTQTAAGQNVAQTGSATTLNAAPSYSCSLFLVMWINQSRGTDICTHLHSCIISKVKWVIKALDKIRDNSEVTHRFGTPLKGYGRDHGGNREGRHNFIEHSEYTNKGRRWIEANTSPFQLGGPSRQCLLLCGSIE